MSLRTDYKNDMFAGKRRYMVTENDDGTISLDDVTEYQQVGDIFSADDINTTNQAVNDIDTENESFKTEITENVNNLSNTVDTLTGEKIIVLSASGWSSTSPYTQTVALSGIKSDSVPTYGLRLTGVLSSTTVEAQKLAWGYVDRIESKDGSVTAYCYSKKPVTTINISVKGV